MKVGAREHLGASTFSRALPGNRLHRHCQEPSYLGEWFPHFSSERQREYPWQALLPAGWAAVSQARVYLLLS